MPDLLDQIADQSAVSAKPADLLDQIAESSAKQQPSAADSLKPYKPTISERIAPAVVSAAGGAEKVVEPFTPAGMLNQPTRLVAAISKSLGGGQIADPFVAGQSLLKDIPEPQGKGYGAVWAFRYWNFERTHNARKYCYTPCCHTVCHCPILFCRTNG